MPAGRLQRTSEGCNQQVGFAVMESTACHPEALLGVAITAAATSTAAAAAALPVLLLLLLGVWWGAAGAGSWHGWEMACC
jgi:hypothetical protein